jgi:hypothetical protein
VRALLDPFGRAWFDIVVARSGSVGEDRSGIRHLVLGGPRRQEDPADCQRCDLCPVGQKGLPRDRPDSSRLRLEGGL